MVYCHDNQHRAVVVLYANAWRRNMATFFMAASVLFWIYHRILLAGAHALVAAHTSCMAATSNCAHDYRTILTRVYYQLFAHAQRELLAH